MRECQGIVSAHKVDSTQVVYSWNPLWTMYTILDECVLLSVDSIPGPLPDSRPAANAGLALRVSALAAR